MMFSWVIWICVTTRSCVSLSRSSHDFIGEFTSSFRDLSRGQSQFNVYEVSQNWRQWRKREGELMYWCWCGYRQIDGWMDGWIDGCKFWPVGLPDIPNRLGEIQTSHRFLPKAPLSTAETRGRNHLHETSCFHDIFLWINVTVEC